MGLRKEKVVRRYKRLINPSYSRILASKKEIYFRPVILTHLFEIPVLFCIFFSKLIIILKVCVIVPWRWRRDKVLLWAFALCKEVREGKKSS